MDFIMICTYEEEGKNPELLYLFIGDGAAKTRRLLGAHPNARFDEDFVISAEGMADIAAGKLATGQTEDIAYFEPFYLKDFIAKKSVVHGLRD